MLTNKVMKHGFITGKMEEILDDGSKITHSRLSEEVDAIIADPSKIELKIPAENVESCYSPIIQSGGHYDIKISAQSDDNILSPDVIICSIGARYKNYCAHMSRTFMVDAPAKVEKTYRTLLNLYTLKIFLNFL